MVKLNLGKFYESKRRKATGLKQLLWQPGCQDYIVYLVNKIFLSNLPYKIRKEECYGYVLPNCSN